jgi:hypothetical protein
MAHHVVTPMRGLLSAAAVVPCPLPADRLNQRASPRPAPGRQRHPPTPPAHSSLETNHETTHPAAGSPCPSLRSRSGFAQTPYPSKPIRYIVPVSAGGGSDRVGRSLTEQGSSLLKQRSSSTTRAAAAA